MIGFPFLSTNRTCDSDVDSCRVKTGEKSRGVVSSHVSLSETVSPEPDEVPSGSSRVDVTTGHSSPFRTFLSFSEKDRNNEDFHVFL